MAAWVDGVPAVAAALLEVVAVADDSGELVSDAVAMVEMSVEDDAEAVAVALLAAVLWRAL